jgi:hypothetical protein
MRKIKYKKKENATSQDKYTGIHKSLSQNAVVCLRWFELQNMMILDFRF